jgi:hypothetical protein
LLPAEDGRLPAVEIMVSAVVLVVAVVYLLVESGQPLYETNMVKNNENSFSLV